jgi:deoxycytidylate deaminase
VDDHHFLEGTLFLATRLSIYQRNFLSRCELPKVQCTGMNQAAKRLPGVHRAVQSGKPTKDQARGTVDQSIDHDVVIAVAGLMGAGPGRVGTRIGAEFESKDYVLKKIDLSKLISDAVGKPTPEDKDERTIFLQQEGTNLRKAHGGSFIAALAISAIAEERPKDGKPVAFVLDSLKHPDEVALLRDVYKSAFYLVGVNCLEDVRRARLSLKFGEGEKSVNEIVQRDARSDSPEGQQVKKVLHLADFIADNTQTVDVSKPDLLSEAISRFVRLVTGRGIERPSRDEFGMYIAWSASLGSACLSRQVGAAILGLDGNVISTGYNEVPKANGGAYDAASEERLVDLADSVRKATERRKKTEKRSTSLPEVPFGRCFNSNTCFNSQKKEEILGEVLDLVDPKELKDTLNSALIGAGVLEEEVQRKVIESLNGIYSRERLKPKLASTRIGSLIEFSRAVHAEMAAIVSVARHGGGSTQGATLYCRTYPCHNCARHIVHSGIKEVVFVEPYSKSLALELHPDSIYEEPQTDVGEDNRVHFRSFTGVAPRRYSILFEERRDLKAKSGNSVGPEHTGYIHSMSHREFEVKISEEVHKALSH